MPSKMKNHLDRKKASGAVCTSMLSVGSLSYFDRRSIHMADKTTTRKTEAPLTKSVQRRDFTKCK